MKAQTRDLVEYILSHPDSYCSGFGGDAMPLESFASVWQLRYEEAKKNPEYLGLAKRALSILTFIRRRDPKTLRHCVLRENGDSYSLLYDEKTRDFLFMSDQE